MRRGLRAPSSGFALDGDGVDQALSRYAGLLFNGLDAVGLSLFAVAGSQKSLDFGLNDVSSASLGVVTAMGGGTMAAVLLGRVPAVLRVDLHAVTRGQRQPTRRNTWEWQRGDRALT